MKARWIANFVAAVLAMMTFSPGLVGAMDGVVMKDGQMMMMKDGKATGPMTREVTMTDGTKVTTSGVVKRKDGEEKKLNNGAMILCNGHMLKGGKATPMQPE